MTASNITTDASRVLIADRYIKDIKIIPQTRSVTDELADEVKLAET
ncbi:MAG: hypothetical protein AAF702_14685 [Chloroflexota bacterium]